MAQARALLEAELHVFLQSHKAWSFDSGALVRTYEASDFLMGIDFVQRVAKLAEAADHHPDIDIRWRNVRLRFTTHDAGNQVTELDMRLALECDLLFDALLK